jgi:CHAT domain
MTITPGGTGLSGKSGQVFVRLADGTHAVAPFSSSEYIDKIESIQNMLLAKATGLEADDNVYKTLREELIHDEFIKPLLPKFVTRNRSLAEFWAFIKTKFSTYRERREFIWGEFRPLLDGLENGSLSHISNADANIRPLAALSDVEIQPQPPQQEKDTTEIQLHNDTKIKSILFLAADPTNESRLRLGEEFREIDEQLRLAKQRDWFKLELPQLSLRPKDITGALLNVEPEIVHFSGHGTAKGALCFENQAGQTQLVEPDALAALFEQFAHQVDCVLLNACYSETQAKAIAKHINYVIGMNEAIGDKAAIAFALGFYQALGARRTIKDAYKLGCVQIRLQDIPEHLTPVLIRRGAT